MTPEKFQELFPIMSETFSSLPWMLKAYDQGDFTAVHVYTGFLSHADDDDEVSPYATRMLMAVGEFGCHPRSTVEDFLITIQKQYQKGLDTYGTSLQFNTVYPSGYLREEVVDSVIYGLAEIKRDPEKALKELNLAVDVFDALCEMAQYELDSKKKVR